MSLHTHTRQFLSVIAAAVALAVPASHAWAQARHKSPAPGSENLLRRPPLEIVDDYFDRIECENKKALLWQSNMNLSLGAQLDAKELKNAFDSPVFYSLVPNEERKGENHLISLRTKTTKILKNLRTLAVFFGHDIHNFHAAENEKRKEENAKRLAEIKAGEAEALPILSKEQFLAEIASKKIILSVDKVPNLMDMMQDLVNEVDTLAKSLNYGCRGNNNFLHRPKSRSSLALDGSAVMIPLTETALAMTPKPKQISNPGQPSRAPASLGPTHTESPAAQLASSTAKPSSSTRPRRFVHYAKFLRAGVPKAALDLAMAEYYKALDRGPITATVKDAKGNSKVVSTTVNTQKMVVVDLPSDSGKPRWWTLNLLTGVAEGLVTTHGSGKGVLSSVKMSRQSPAFVSDVPESNASTYGPMVLFGPKYESSKKFALNIVGLAPHNANMQARGVITHWAENNGEPYVFSNDAGRSEGCFAFDYKNAKKVYESMPMGTFVYSYRGKIPIAYNREDAKKYLQAKNR